MMRLEQELPEAPVARTLKLEGSLNLVGQAKVDERAEKLGDLPLSLVARALANYCEFRCRILSWCLIKDIRESSGAEGWSNAFDPSPLPLAAAEAELRANKAAAVRVLLPPPPPPPPLQLPVAWGHANFGERSCNSPVPNGYKYSEGYLAADNDIEVASCTLKEAIRRAKEGADNWYPSEIVGFCYSGPKPEECDPKQELCVYFKCAKSSAQVHAP